MYSFEQMDLGSYCGDAYFLTGLVDPDPAGRPDYDPELDADDYGVVLARRDVDPIASNIEIVRMDTRHGRPHLDKVYLPADSSEDRKRWLDEPYAYSRMRTYILNYWQVFADWYSYYHE